MRIGITGATGFIGSHVAAHARHHGHEVIAFSRTPDKPKPGFSETCAFSTDATPDVSGLDAVVHLAGENLLGLWTPPKKRRIGASRVEGTRRVVEALTAASEPPRVFICGSAIGYYGDTGETSVDESASPGTGFLADVSTHWEAEVDHAPASVRTVKLRTGFVLGDGGAMKLVAPIFRCGLGGRLGSGQQWMSCIHVDDVAGLVLHAIENKTLNGPLNAVLPEPSRNVEFTHAAARAAHRPAMFPAPEIALKVALGELHHLVLDSQRVIPKAALESDYQYRHPTLASALDAIFTG